MMRKLSIIENLMPRIKIFLKVCLRPNHKLSIVSRMKPQNILDVGCGHAGAFEVKLLSRDTKYTGVDICDYKQTCKNKLLMDEYIVTNPEAFHSTISDIKECFSLVISCHNFEHVNDRHATLLAMCGAVAPDGILFMAFPSSNSVDFPKRKGTLNYFDDVTHSQPPPNLQEIRDIVLKSDFSQVFVSKNYSPLFLRLVGLFLEPVSKFLGKKMPGSWEYYGFETIVVFKRSTS
ncbi:class I SAM-dependent methyltransferase [Planktomarina temperata]|nr:class I SAM-dependent methyltransferase [Planktomarina temperata]